jgi:chitinase
MARTFPSILVLTLLFGSSVLSAAQRRDRIPPTAPTNLTVTATTEHSASLAWDPSTDNSGRFNYIIRGGESTVTVGQETTSHTLEDLHPGKTYTFRVYAQDAAGNLSDSSNPVTVTLPGELGAPTKPVVGTLDVGPTHASMSWSSTDDGPFIWYTVYIDGEPVTTLNSRSDTLTCAAVLVPTGCIPLDQETTYTVTVDARDVDGNFSPPSDPVFVTTHPAPNDHTPPDQPANVAADFNGHIVVTWDPSTDDLAPQAFIRYDVYVNGELRGVVVGRATAEVEADVGVNEIAVVAVDTADNESAPGTTTFNL